MSATSQESRFGERKGYSALSVVWSIVGAMVGALVLSFIYGPCEHYSPLVYLNILLAYILGLLIGMVGKVMLRKFRITGHGAARVVGVVGGLAGVWFAWLAYIWVITGYDFEEYTAAMQYPAYLWHIIQYLAHNPM